MADDGPSMRDRMLAGELYVADDPVLDQEHQGAMALLEAINRSPAADPALRRKLFTELLGDYGDGAEIRPPFYCDYGWQTHVGARTFANFGLRNPPLTSKRCSRQEPSRGTGPCSG